MVENWPRGSCFLSIGYVLITITVAAVILRLRLGSLSWSGFRLIIGRNARPPRQIAFGS
jgi:hypothetical protein